MDTTAMDVGRFAKSKLAAAMAAILLAIGITFAVGVTAAQATTVVSDTEYKVAEFEPTSSDYGTAALRARGYVKSTSTYRYMTFVFFDRFTGNMQLQKVDFSSFNYQQAYADKLGFNTAYQVFMAPTSEVEAALQDAGLSKDATWATRNALSTLSERSEIKETKTKELEMASPSSPSVTTGFTSSTLSWYDYSSGAAKYWFIYKDGKRVQVVANTNHSPHEYKVSHAYGAKNLKYSVMPVYAFYDFAGQVRSVPGEKETLNFSTFNGRLLPKPSIKVTRISSGKASIKVTGEGKGYIVYMKSGKKWKKVKTTSKSGLITISKKKAGKAKFRVQSYIKSGKKTYTSAYSKARKGKKNIYKTGVATYPKAYSNYKSLFRATQFYYSGGKLKMKGIFINTHLYTISHAKFKVDVYSSRGIGYPSKKIGTATVKVGKMKSSSTKKVTVTLKKGKKNVDLVNNRISSTVTLLSER